MTDWLLDVGPSVGERAIGYCELAAWQEITGVELDAWEARTLRRLSIEYLGQSVRSRKPDCPAPFTGTTQQERDKVATQFAAMMSAVKARSLPNRRREGR